jgi:nucleoside-diphosphate-sugar epimerase
VALTIGAYGLAAVSRVTNRTFSLNIDKLNELFEDYWTCSNRKARERLGFSPEFALSAGWRDAVEWYKRNKWI